MPEEQPPEAAVRQERTEAEDSENQGFLAGVFNELRGWARDVLVAAVAAVLIVVFVVQPVKVEGTSMAPRLADQERIFVSKLSYRFSNIERGDIVVFWYPRNPAKSFIKRVIGIPGETVEIKGGVVFVDGRRLEEPYLRPEYLDHDYHTSQVPEDQYFVLGDRRNSSNDSRNWGCVPRRNIFGKAVFRYWPVSKAGMIE